MKKSSWLACGVLGLGALISGACGSDDDSGSGSPSTTGSGGTNTTGSGGSSNTTSTATTNTTGSGGTSSGGSSAGGAMGTGGSAGEAGGGMGGTAGEAGAGGMGGAPPEPPSCDEIPSRAFGEEFSVSSPDFENCAPMPEETTCEGKPFPESVSPEVSWTEGPEGTMSYAVTFTDITILEVRDPTDHPSYNQGYHWVIWDIPPETLSIPAELSSGHLPADIDGARQFAPFNDYGYMGPCPNMPPPEEGDPPPLNNDSYSFTVYAMPTAITPVPATGDGRSFPRVMDDYLRQNALAAAEYRGTSNAQASEILEGTFPPMFDLPCPSEGEQPEGCLTGE